MDGLMLMGNEQSSLTLALLRCILTEGTVLYDGVDTGTINLDALRSNITIIPQVVSFTRLYFRFRDSNSWGIIKA